MSPAKVDMQAFGAFLKIDRCLAGDTLKDYVGDTKAFLKRVGPTFDKAVIRSYLTPLTANRRRKTIAALKSFYKFVERPEVMDGFKIPRSRARLIRTPSRNELSQFYAALPDTMQKTMFLMLASSGLRLSEVISLKFEDVDFEKRMLTPNCHEGSTKHSYMTFYSQEAATSLGRYLEEYSIAEGQLFSVAKRTVQKALKETADKLNVKISAQVLRE